MRRFLAYMAVVTLALFPGCSDSRNFYESLPPLTFNPVVSMFTKSETPDTAFPRSSTFSFWGYSLPASSPWSGSMDSANEIYSDEGVAFAGGKWSPAGAPVWEKGGKGMTFFAVSPSGSGYTFDRRKGVCFNGFDIRTGSRDVMFAEPVYDMESTHGGGVVNLRFIPALCEVVFYAFSSLPEDISLKVKSLELSGMAYTGDFIQLPEPKWTAGAPGEACDFPVTEAVLTDIPVRLGSALLLPQSLTGGVKLVCDVTQSGSTAAGQEFTASKKMIWGTGRKCIYVLNVSEKMKFSNDWGDLQ